MNNEKGKPVGLETGLFDNQSLQWFRDCPTYYYWRAVKQLIKPGAKKTAADFGSAIHSALEHYYSKEMTDQSISEAIQIFSDYFSPFQDPTDEKRSLLKGIQILTDYFIRYRHENFKVIATEVGGVFELGPYLYTVRIDLTSEWKSPKGIYGWDHKTTSNLNYLIVKPHNQITGYEYMLRESYEDVLGFVMNCIGVYDSEEVMDKNLPKIPSTKTGKPVYQKVKREIFQRLPTTRTRSELEKWKKETLFLIEEIARHSEKGVWPQHTSFCTAFRSKCQYLDLCQAQDREIYLPLMESGVYEMVPWVPYKDQGIGEEEPNE